VSQGGTSSQHAVGNGGQRARADAPNSTLDLPSVVDDQEI
jgi:hypothetical protein